LSGRGGSAAASPVPQPNGFTSSTNRQGRHIEVSVSRTREFRFLVQALPKKDFVWHLPQECRAGSDQFIPAIESTKAANILRPLGVEVKEPTLPGVPHTISAEGAAKAGTFLSEALVNFTG